MVGNCENNNEWPQNYNQIDEKGMNHMASTGKFHMDQKPPTTAAGGQEQQQQALKCPRCDSSNTKFCYYNNYSLTQPRHFCKACKRYWTRGGTLRNVPVGGGCRKNKRIMKRPSSSSSSCSSFSSINDPPLLPPSSSSTPPPPITTTTTNHINPLLYGLPNNPSELNHLQFHGYDLDLDGHRHHQQHQLSGLGLGGFSSGLMLNDDYRNGFASNSLLSSYGSMFGSSPSITSTNTTTTTTTAPIMASIIASSLQQQQKFTHGCGEGYEGNRVANYHFKSLSPFENMQIASTNSGEAGGIGVKVEEGQQNMFGWSTSSSSVVVPSSQNHQIQQINGSSSDNPSLYWNNTNWPDLANIGSSVTSLI